MKARVKATGEMIVVEPHKEMFVTKENRWYSKEQLVFSFEEDFDYWTRLEHQYAGMAMHAVLSLVSNSASPEYVAEEASAYAHELVEKLKSESK